MNHTLSIRCLFAAAWVGALALPLAAMAQSTPAAAPAAVATPPAAGATPPAANANTATKRPPASAQKTTLRKASIPARGLFQGDQLSDSTKRQLTDLMLDAIGTQIELALLVPTGPWQIDGAGQGDTVMNEARLRSLRRFLTDRGVDPSRILVERRVDPKVKTPRLDIELVTTPATE